MSDMEKERLRRIEAALNALYNLHRCPGPSGGDACEICAMQEKLEGR